MKWVNRNSLVLAVALAGLLAADAGVAQLGAENGEWRHYAGGAGSSKYAPLDQIDRDNVGEVEIAWTWESPDVPIIKDGKKFWHGSFENTPLMVDDVLYVVTSFNIAVALNPRTGETIWSYDPGVYEKQRMAPNKGFIHRGLSYWEDGDDKRILYGTASAYLIALDAATGEPVPGFGEEGWVDLTLGLRRKVPRYGVYGVNSPVVICRDVVVVGSSILDSWRTLEGIPGDVRGYDVRTGEQLWTFHTVAQPGEFGADTWEDGSNVPTGSANVWAPYSADEELGYVYLPVSSSTSDYYGGHRLGDNLFSQSLVCLDAKTGERVWHFQTVHHGVWDYDNPCAPNLMDITVDGKTIKAVTQLTKQGFAYTFDRVTGEPVWPIEERAVPQSDVPGERTSPTQPFPTKPPAFAPQGVTEDSLNDLTPAIKEEALRIASEYRMGPLYTPPSLEGTLVLPGYGGGANWNGGAFDPETGVLYVPTTTLMIRYMLTEPDPARSQFRYGIGGAIYFQGPFGMPMAKPPWAHITAFDMNKGELLWTIPHGDPVQKPSDIAFFRLPNEELQAEFFESAKGKVLGGAMFSPALVTKTLLFIGRGRASGGPGMGRPLLEAFDKATGEVVWEIKLPAHSTGGPMTYMSGGKQYIVVATGGGRGKPPGRLVALSLP